MAKLSNLSIGELQELLVLKILQEWDEKHSGISMPVSELSEEFNTRWGRLIRMARESA